MPAEAVKKIKSLTEWILGNTGKERMNILDLGCGPGLYAELLAQKGHSVTAIDFSESSIQYAISQAKAKQLKIEYIAQNYLDMNFEGQFDLVMLIYLDFCALLPDERDKVLEKIYKALKKGGLFICDVVNEKNLDKKIIAQSWEVRKSGFWKNTPYLALSNGYHYPEAKVLANHHIVIGEKDEVNTYIFGNHYYTKEELVPILQQKGFTDIQTCENVLPDSDCSNGENVTFYRSKKE
ncbi:MAG: class I SAM-dependent methyltransferase [Proteiniphilum sp.]